MIIIITGPAGAGKSTVGFRLATALGWNFHDADALHSPESIDSMRRGAPLDDRSRSPWLDAIAALVSSLVKAGQPAVIACSALRRSYRERLRGAASDAQVRFVYLRARERVLAERLAERREHFFPAALLASQLATLEEPSAADAGHTVAVDAEQPVSAIIAEIRRVLGV